MKLKPETSKVEKPTPNRGLTRQKIIAAALEEFATRGKQGARIDRIARSAKVNKAMIYYHFNSKDSLYLEVVTSFFRSVSERAENTVLATDTLEDALTALTKLHADMFLQSKQFAPLILRELADSNPEILDEISDIFNTAGIPQKIAALLGDGMRAGEYRQTDIRQALVAFASMSLYYHIMAPFINRLLSIDNPRQFAADRQKVIVDIFLNGLKVR